MRFEAYGKTLMILIGASLADSIRTSKGQLSFPISLDVILVSDSKIMI